MDIFFNLICPKYKAYICNVCALNVETLHNFEWKLLQLHIINTPQCFSDGRRALIWGSCNLKRSRRTVNVLPVYKISSLKITLPKTLQLKTLDFLQQTITMNENEQWQIIKDTVVFTLSSGFSVSLFHFYLKKISTRGVLFCISSFFSLHQSLYLLLAYCLYRR